MKNWLGVSKFLVLLCLLSVGSIVGSQSFDRAAGFEVLTTYTSQDTACMKSDSTRVILRTTEPTIEEFLNSVQLSEVLQSLQQLGIKQQIEVEFVGPNTTVGQINTRRQRWNNAMRSACITLRPMEIGSNDTELTFSSPSAGFVYFENLDAGNYTDDNAQAVNLVGPTTVGNPPLATALLNNVVTDSSTFYFIQNGFLFWNGSGSVVWTNTTQGLVAQFYSGLTYSGGTSFWFTITYTNGDWWMCGLDYSTLDYDCVPESSGFGTTLAGDLNTNIFFENHNLTANWHSGFSGDFEAWGAEIYRNGFGQDWATQHRHTGHACPASYPTSGAMSGSLAGGGTGSFTPAGVPLSC